MLELRLILATESKEPHEVLERKTVREVGGVFHPARRSKTRSRTFCSTALLDIDQLASIYVVHKPFNLYVAPKEVVHVRRAPPRPAFKRDDIAVTYVVSLLGAAAGGAAAFGMLRPVAGGARRRRESWPSGASSDCYAALPTLMWTRWVFVATANSSIASSMTC